jgi:hypothetical protein
MVLKSYIGKIGSIFCNSLPENSYFRSRKFDQSYQELRKSGKKKESKKDRIDKYLQIKNISREQWIRNHSGQQIILQ